MKQRALRDRDDCSIWSSEKYPKVFLKINGSVKYSLKKLIISHPHAIQSPISNYYITFKFSDVTIGVNTELRQKVILQVSVRELHIYTPKNMLLGFP